MKRSSSAHSTTDIRYTLQFDNLVSSTSSIAWSHCFLSGKVLKDSFANMSANCQKWGRIALEGSFRAEFFRCASANYCKKLPVAWMTVAKILLPSSY